MKFPICYKDENNAGLFSSENNTVVATEAPKMSATCDVVPVVISGPPVEVGVTMYVLSISSLSEVKMVLVLSLCLLTLSSNIYKDPIIASQSLSISARPLPDSRVWRPGEAGWCYVIVVRLQARPWRWESLCTC